MTYLRRLALIWLLAGAPPMALAAPANVAVATNFHTTAALLAEQFMRQTDHEVQLVSGSTGKLFAQIVNGAPYHVFLAADQERPRLLELRGLAVAGSRSTYAVGRLVLLGQAPVDATTLATADFHHLAIANPKLAPYGMAARQALQTLGVYETVHARLIYGENVGQAFAMVASGNAELGLVAHAQLAMREDSHFWAVPEDMYEPIKQDLVLLNQGASNPAALAFAAFIRGDFARRIIEQHGYLTQHDG